MVRQACLILDFRKSSKQPNPERQNDNIFQIFFGNRERSRLHRSDSRWHLLGINHMEFHANDRWMHQIGINYFGSFASLSSFDIFTVLIIQFPLFQLPMLLKTNKIDRSVLRQSLSTFIDFFMGAWLISGFGLSFICLFR